MKYLKHNPRVIRRYHPMPGTIRGRVINPPTEDDRITIAEAVMLAESGTQHNRAAVQDDRVCGCAHCLNFFPGMSVRSWVNVSEDPTEWADDTAACPFCGHDAVLPSVSGWPMSVPFFYALHELLYPNDGYSDPRTIIFWDSREEVATLREEGIDRSAAYEVRVRPSARCKAPAQPFPDDDTYIFCEDPDDE